MESETGRVVERSGVEMKIQVVYISRLMKASEVREACAVVRLMPDRYLIGETLKEKEKAAMSASNTMTA
jgi:hypothetical protein